MSRPRYFTASEVAVHNIPSDCWVSFLGVVYNLTSLCEKYAGDILLKPIVAYAGKDISHWFDLQTKDVSDIYYIYNSHQYTLLLFTRLDKEAYPSSDRVCISLHTYG